ncbi:hypothetical protein ON010_g18376 [Phytophthora cinnamomi]|nr:hypothetical protein ON010_g18376 [Phytophthora cinnamomi]
MVRQRATHGARAREAAATRGEAAARPAAERSALVGAAAGLHRRAPAEQQRQQQPAPVQREPPEAADRGRAAVEELAGAHRGVRRLPAAHQAGRAQGRAALLVLHEGLRRQLRQAAGAGPAQPLGPGHGAAALGQLVLVGQLQAARVPRGAQAGDAARVRGGEDPAGAPGQARARAQAAAVRGRVRRTRDAGAHGGADDRLFAPPDRGAADAAEAARGGQGECQQEEGPGGRAD